VGKYALQYAPVVGPSGCVLGLEPDPDIAGHARLALAKYPWVTVQAVGLDAAPGRRTLYRDHDKRRSSLWASNRLEADDEIDVVLTTLDTVAALVPHLRGIKIDAQGAEARILAGGGVTLARPEIAWFVEIWPEGLREAGSSAEALMDTFAAHGFVPERHTWASLRAHVPTQRGHSSMDVVIRHAEAA